MSLLGLKAVEEMHYSTKGFTYLIEAVGRVSFIAVIPLCSRGMAAINDASQRDN